MMLGKRRKAKVSDLFRVTDDGGDRDKGRKKQRFMVIVAEY